MNSLRTLVESRAFGLTVLGVILANGVLIAWQTYAPEAGWIRSLLAICLGIFVGELILKLSVATRFGTLGAFLRDGWNIFDIIVIAGSFLPQSDPTLAAIARVIRVLRVFRLVRSVPELRVIVTVLVKSLVSMKYISLLALVILFIYGVIGVKLFGPFMPKEYGTLHESAFTLFRVLTGDNWSDLRYAADGQPWQWKSTLYHVSWIIVSTFLLINLIVGAVLNNYQQVQEAEANLRDGPRDLSDERLHALAEEMQAILRARGHSGERSRQAPPEHTRAGSYSS
ncbi:MAG: ion transporter [Planctomycetota bacterium]|nr:ion transporter [Planctomycetota bacterium]